MAQYDYLILGAGAAGLQLALAMAEDAYFKNASILLIDKAGKSENDRTWCFWEAGEGFFDAIVFKKWTQLRFKGSDFTKRFSIAPYQYKMLRSADFYSFMKNSLAAYPNIVIKQEEVLQLGETEHGCTLVTNQNTHFAKRVFNSILDSNLFINQNKVPVLLQHFVGWLIKTDRSVFCANTATFMDFSIKQDGNTRFMYVLPYTAEEALIEYTLFSDAVLQEEDYKNALEDYLKTDLLVQNYTLLSKEKGSIPMTMYDFTNQNTPRITNIGTAGGWTKPSTGYTFANIQKNIPILIRELKSGTWPIAIRQKPKFRFYDSLLLDILDRENHKGAEIFSSIFKHAPPEQILRFLGENSNLLEDFRIIASSPKKPFLRALKRYLLRFPRK